jgi:hypothetical protein
MAESITPFYVTLERLVERNGKMTPESVQKEFYQWPKQNLIKDLTEVINGLNPESLVVSDGIGKANYLEVYKINYHGNEIDMRWVHETFLLIAMKENDIEVVNAFANIMGYKPFVRYINPTDNMITYEWDNVDREKRFKILEEESKLELERI